MRLRMRPHYRMTLGETAACAMRVAAEIAYPLETGGLLVGFLRERCVVVVRAVEVSDEASTRSSYERRETQAQDALDRIRGELGYPHGYVGDWHSHPALVAPSGQDLRSLKRIARQYEHPIGLVVVARTPMTEPEYFAAIGYGRRISKLSPAQISMVADSDPAMSHAPL